MTRGELRFGAKDLTSLAAPQRVRLGIAQVLEGRRVFGHMTPLENLLAATDVQDFYLGGGGRVDYKNVRHYRRRKRWLA